MVSDYYAGRVAVITGAGSGIGRAIALELAGRGARLGLCDLDAASVEETGRRCRAVGADVRAHHLDVTAHENVVEYAESISATFGGVDLVFCVAGVIISGSLLDSDTADVDHLLDVNVRGVLYTAKAFLPSVVRSPRGHIVTVSSAFGLLAAPNYTAYSASKFAVRGLSESLQQEMALLGHRVTVTCAYPGGVRTPIVRNGRFAPGEDQAAIIARFEESIARTDPEVAARTILRAVERGRARVLVGRDAQLVSLVARAMGSSYVRVMPRVLRLMQALSKFQSRSDRARGD